MTDLGLIPNRIGHIAVKRCEKDRIEQRYFREQRRLACYREPQTAPTT